MSPFSSLSLSQFCHWAFQLYLSSTGINKAFWLISRLFQYNGCTHVQVFYRLSWTSSAFSSGSSWSPSGCCQQFLYLLSSVLYLGAKHLTRNWLNKSLRCIYLFFPSFSKSLKDQAVVSGCSSICASSCGSCLIRSPHVSKQTVSHWWIWAETNLKCSFRISRVHIIFYYHRGILILMLLMWWFEPGAICGSPGCWIYSVQNVTNVPHKHFWIKLKLYLAALVNAWHFVGPSQQQFFRNKGKLIISQETKSALRHCDDSDYVFLLLKNGNEAHSLYTVLNCPCLEETGVRWVGVTQGNFLTIIIIIIIILYAEYLLFCICSV